MCPALYTRARLAKFNVILLIGYRVLNKRESEACHCRMGGELAYPDHSEEDADRSESNLGKRYVGGALYGVQNLEECIQRRIVRFWGIFCHCRDSRGSDIWHRNRAENPDLG